MGWRPRKSFKIGKCFRINLSKSGIGWGAGIPGLFSFGVGGDGRKRAGVGGGLTRFENQWGSRQQTKDDKGGCCGCLVLVVLLLIGLGVFGAVYNSTDASSPEPEPANIDAKPEIQTEDKQESEQDASRDRR